jgi:hypothetical protein
MTESNLNLPACVIGEMAGEGGTGSLKDDPNVPLWWPSKGFEWEAYPGKNGVTLAITVYPFNYHRETKDAEFFSRYAFAVEYIESPVIRSGVKLQRSNVTPGQIVAADAFFILDTEQPMDVIAESSIETLDDDPMTGLPLRWLDNVQGTVTFSDTWDSATAAPGYYRWVLRILNTDGTLMARSLKTFVVGGAAVYVTDLTTAPADFKPGDGIDIHAKIRNAGDQPVTGTVHIQVQGSNDQRLAEFQEDVTDLAPGGERTVSTAVKQIPVGRADAVISAFVVYDGTSSPIRTLQHAAPLPGDVDWNDVVDLADAIKLLRCLAGDSEFEIYARADVSGDAAAGMEEALYIVQEIAELRVDKK